MAFHKMCDDLASPVGIDKCVYLKIYCAATRPPVGRHSEWNHKCDDLTVPAGGWKSSGQQVFWTKVKKVIRPLFPVCVFQFSWQSGLISFWHNPCWLFWFKKTSPRRDAWFLKYGWISGRKILSLNGFDPFSPPSKIESNKVPQTLCIQDQVHFFPIMCGIHFMWHFRNVVLPLSLPLPCDERSSPDRNQGAHYLCQTMILWPAGGLFTQKWVWDFDLGEGGFCCLTMGPGGGGGGTRDPVKIVANIFISFIGAE